MKQSDLEFLLKFENIQTSNHKRVLQNLLQQKQTLIDKCDALNCGFQASESDIQAASYLRFIAIENMKIKQKIQTLEHQITQTQEHIRECVKEEEKYTILKQDMIKKIKKKHADYQENQIQEYTIFKYNKPT